ncbi:hypothetical protein [Nisaea sp.]|uniref:hypothetical protein n=1 Tax=Nisaea sp. TaxID=2024842 RepID=UPI0032EE093E
MAETDLDTLIASVSEKVSGFKSTYDETADEFAARKAAKDRSYIGYIVVGMYAAAVLIVLFATWLNFPEFTCTAGTDCQTKIGHWLELAKFMLEVISVAVLPVVTLVIGFYFGSERSKTNNT